MEDKKCKNCRWFPCTKFECNIGSKNGCLDFESTVQKELKDMQMKLVKQEGDIWKFEYLN